MTTNNRHSDGRWTAGASGNPAGRQVQHGVAKLAAARRGGVLDEESEAAVCARMNEYAADAGGLQNLSNRELSIARDVAIVDLLITEIFAYARRRGSIFLRNGQLIPVLDRNLATYLNTKRLHLVALGLKPDRSDKTPTLTEYMASKQTTTPNGHSEPPASAPAAPATEPSTSAADAAETSPCSEERRP